MTGPVIYFDHSEIIGGKHEELKIAINGLVDHIRANEPELIGYNVYFSDDNKRMSVLHIHTDSISLEYHLRTIEPLLPKFAGLVRLLSIDVFGAVDVVVIGMLKQKVSVLGTGNIRIHRFHNGYNTFIRT